MPKRVIKEEESEEYESGRERISNNYLWILIILVVLVILIDVITVFAYYKPSISLPKVAVSTIYLPSFICRCNAASSAATGAGGKVCSDGTAIGSCSTNKPYYCYNGELLKSAHACGCPTGYVQDFQDCKLSSNSS